MILAILSIFMPTTHGTRASFLVFLNSKTYSYNVNADATIPESGSIVTLGKTHSKQIRLQVLYNSWYPDMSMVFIVCEKNNLTEAQLLEAGFTK